MDSTQAVTTSFRKYVLWIIMRDHSQIKHNLLTEGIFEVNVGSEAKPLNLPEILSALSRRAPAITSFNKLMPHQKQAWYSFLVQLAAISCFRAGLKDPPIKADKWKEILKILTPDWPREEPWHLIVNDLSRPAFFQPPVPEGTLTDFREITEPDSDGAADLLVLTKNHDVKKGRIHHASCELWAYSLITVQTMGGYPGRGHTQISRMNSGYGNRPMVTIVPGIDWNNRFLNDLEMLLNNRDRVISNHEFLKGDRELLWLYEWDGNTGLELGELAPYYIEVCRRMRLIKKNGKIIMNIKNAGNCRISGAKQLKGNVGDPWIPIEKKGEKALTIGKSGFRYDKLCEILFSGNYKTNICAAFNDDENYLYCSALTRGKGKTTGLHERTVRIPDPVKNMLLNRRELAARISENWIEDAGSARIQCLKPALLSLIQGASRELKWQDTRVEKWLHKFTLGVDRIFFNALWEVLIEADSSGKTDTEINDKARSKWRNHLKDIAVDIFQEAKKALPIPSAQKYRTIAISEDRLNRYLSSFLKDTYENNRAQDRKAV